LAAAVLRGFLESLTVAGRSENRRLRGQMVITQFVTTLNRGNLANVGDTPEWLPGVYDAAQLRLIARFMTLKHKRASGREAYHRILCSRR